MRAGPRARRRRSRAERRACTDRVRGMRDGGIIKQSETVQTRKSEGRALLVERVGVRSRDAPQWRRSLRKDPSERRMGSHSTVHRGCVPARPKCRQYGGRCKKSVVIHRAEGPTRRPAGIERRVYRSKSPQDRREEGSWLAFAAFWTQMCTHVCRPHRRSSKKTHLILTITHFWWRLWLLSSG